MRYPLKVWGVVAFLALLAAVPGRAWGKEVTPPTKGQRVKAQSQVPVVDAKKNDDELGLGSAGEDGDKAINEARQHFKQGVSLYEEEDYDAALVEFRKAYEVKPSYRILYNIGQVEAVLKNYAKALVAFKKYLDDGKDEIPPERKIEVIDEITKLRGRIGYLKVSSKLAGAKVEVDDELLGEAPPDETPYVLDIGDHLINVEYNGNPVFRRRMELAAGDTILVGPEEEAKPPPVVAPVPVPPVEEKKEPPKEKKKEPPKEAKQAPPPPPQEMYTRNGFGISQGVGAVFCFGDVPCGGTGVGLNLDLGLYYRIIEYVSVDLGFQVGGNPINARSDVSDGYNLKFTAQHEDYFGWFSVFLGSRAFFIDKGMWDPYVGAYVGYIRGFWNSTVALKNPMVQPGIYAVPSGSDGYTAGTAFFDLSGVSTSLAVGVNMILYKGVTLGVDIRAVYTFWLYACTSFSYRSMSLVDEKGNSLPSQKPTGNSNLCSKKPKDNFFEGGDLLPIFLLGNLQFLYTF